MKAAPSPPSLDNGTLAGMTGEKVDGKLESSHVETSSIRGAVEPSVHFDKKAEKRLYRKMDIRLLPVLAILYLVAFLDRGK